MCVPLLSQHDVSVMIFCSGPWRLLSFLSPVSGSIPLCVCPTVHCVSGDSVSGSIGPTRSWDQLRRIGLICWSGHEYPGPFCPCPYSHILLLGLPTPQLPPTCRGGLAHRAQRNCAWKPFVWQVDGWWIRMQVGILLQHSAPLRTFSTTPNAVLLPP